MRHGSAPLCAALAVLAIAASAATADAEEYPSSVVGTDFDFIQDGDPSTFLCLEAKGRGAREMPDKRGPTPLFQDAFIFVAYFSDGTSVDFAMAVAFETAERAQKDALRYATRLGKLPTSLRRGVKRVVVHAGGRDTTAFSDVGLIVLYAENATKRIGTHDLEETLFHESVHAAWDKAHAQSASWREAVERDGTFITRYARKNPRGEDLAESALFAYTLLHHPERIPEDHAARIREAIPARIAFVKTLVPPDKPIFFQVAPRYACDGSGVTFRVQAPAHDPDEPDEDPADEGKRPTIHCDVDITRVGTLSDILSNALMHGLDQEESEVRAFLEAAKQRHKTADALLEATSAEFGFARDVLDANVQEFLHCNCDHGPLPEATTDGDTPAAAPTAAAPPTPASETTPTPAILYVIAALLLALLIVNTITLVVLLRRSRA